mgnify:CR=1 FL=1
MSGAPGENNMPLSPQSNTQTQGTRDDAELARLLDIRKSAYARFEDGQPGAGGEVLMTDASMALYMHDQTGDAHWSRTAAALLAAAKIVERPVSPTFHLPPI